MYVVVVKLLVCDMVTWTLLRAVSQSLGFRLWNDHYKGLCESEPHCFKVQYFFMSFHF